MNGNIFSHGTYLLLITLNYHDSIHLLCDTSINAVEEFLEILFRIPSQGGGEG